MSDLSPTQIGVSLALEAHRRGFFDDPTLQRILAHWAGERASHDPPEQVLSRLGGLTGGQLRVVLESGRQLDGAPTPADAGHPFGARLILFERLGAGAMGTVYRAHDRVLQRSVAVKVLKLDDVEDPARRALRLRRFEREAHVMARVRHPSVVGVHDAGVTKEGEAYLVMELVSGESLASILRTRAPLDPLRVARWGLSLAQALEACHAVGVIHRDIKPANVLIDTDDLARLTDFGVAHDDEARTRLTQDHGAIGTLAYMAPEQLSGRAADQQTDLYSLGATLHEALTSATLFAAQHPAALLRMVLEAAPPEIRRTRPECPAALEDVIQRCLAKSPADRPRTAGDLAQELARVISGSAATRSRPRARRASPARLGAVLGVAVVGGVTAFAALRSDPPSSIAPPPVTPAAAGSAASASDPTGLVHSAPRPDPSVPSPSAGAVEDLGEGRGVTRRGGVQLVWVPAGVCIQGAPIGVTLTALDPPRRTVRFERGFWIGRSEITRAEYSRYCAETGALMPSGAIRIGAVDQAVSEDHPVVHVEAAAAAAYAAWVGGRLPTADEWEYAARGVDGRPWPWGSEWSSHVPRANVSDAALGRALGAARALDDVVWRLDDGFPALAPVGSFPEGRSPFGCLDMIGNANEWLADRNGDGKPLVLGGSWQLSDWNARPWARFGVDSQPYPNVGVRVVVDGP